MCNCNKECNCKKEKKCENNEIYNYLSEHDKILFVGEYDINDNTQNNSTTVTVPCNISINKCGMNIGIVEYIYVNDKTNNNLKLIYETYTFSSYKKECEKNKFNKKVGQITWNGFYPDNGTIGNTTSNFQQFTILGRSGIYNKINKVIIDFRKPIRKIHFISER